MRCGLATLAFTALFSTKPVIGCWYQSKHSAFQHIERFLETHGVDGEDWNPSVPITRKALEGVVHDAPGAVGWFIEKVNSVDGVMNDCDSNNDGLIYIDEAKKAEHCVDSCWKQVALQAFLN